MERKSSIHIEKAQPGEFFHNDRTKPTTNAIFSDENNYYNLDALKAIELYRKDIKEKTKKYVERTGRSLHKNTITLLSAIVNLNETHTQKDLEKICKYLEETLGTKVYQYAIHKDEGWIDEETGEKHINYHAHILFSGLDKEGRSVRKKLTRSYLIKLQDEVAKILKMKRGINYTKERKKRPKRLDTYEYKEHAKRAYEKLKPFLKENKKLKYENTELKAKKQNAEKVIKEEKREKEQLKNELKKQIVKNLKDKVKHLARIKDLKQLNNELRQELKELGGIREDYAKLEQAVKELKEQVKNKELTIQDLQNKIQEIKEQLEKEIKKRKNAEQKNRKLQKENKKLQEDLEEKTIYNKVLNQISDDLTKEKNKLKEEIENKELENEALKDELIEQTNEITKLKNQLKDLSQKVYSNKKLKTGGYATWEVVANYYEKEYQKLKKEKEKLEQELLKRKQKELEESFITKKVAIIETQIVYTQKVFYTEAVSTDYYFVLDKFKREKIIKDYEVLDKENKITKIETNRAEIVDTPTQINAKFLTLNLDNKDEEKTIRTEINKILDLIEATKNWDLRNIRISGSNEKLINLVKEEVEKRIIIGGVKPKIRY